MSETSNRVKVLLSELNHLTYSDTSHSLQELFASLPPNPEPSFFSTAVSSFLDDHTDQNSSEDPEIAALRNETRRLDLLIAEREKFLTATLPEIRAPKIRHLSLIPQPFNFDSASPSSRPSAPSAPPQASLLAGGGGGASLLAQVAGAAELERLEEIDLALLGLEISSTNFRSIEEIDQALALLEDIKLPITNIFFVELVGTDKVFASDQESEEEAEAEEELREETVEEEISFDDLDQEMRDLGLKLDTINVSYSFC